MMGANRCISVWDLVPRLTLLLDNPGRRAGALKRRHTECTLVPEATDPEGLSCSLSLETGMLPLLQKNQEVA